MRLTLFNLLKAPAHSNIYRLPLWRRQIPKYPVYLKGGPQNRVFMCQFWMKIVKPYQPIPPDQVHFQIHPQMSQQDVKQYLEKLYQVPVLKIRIGYAEGEFKKDDSTRIVDKAPDKKFAFVHLDGDQTFEFPDPPTEKEEMSEDTLEAKKGAEKEEKEKKLIPNIDQFERKKLPVWFR